MAPALYQMLLVMSDKREARTAHAADDAEDLLAGGDLLDDLIEDGALVGVEPVHPRLVQLLGQRHRRCHQAGLPASDGDIFS